MKLIMDSYPEKRDEFILEFKSVNGKIKEVPCRVICRCGNLKG
jgi:hypothetical protein